MVKSKYTQTHTHTTLLNGGGGIREKEQMWQNVDSWWTKQGVYKHSLYFLLSCGFDSFKNKNWE